MTLHFTVPGAPVSNNRVTRRFGNRSVKNPAAVTYQQLVFQHAFAAAQQAEWKWPQASAVCITAYNARPDIDNLAKCVLDGMQGAAYEDDKSVIELRIFRLRDNLGIRLTIHVEPREPLEIPKRRRKAA